MLAPTFVPNTTRSWHRGCEASTYDFFALATGAVPAPKTVRVRGIDEGPSRLEETIENCHRGRLVDFGAEVHGAETHLGHLQATYPIGDDSGPHRGRGFRTT